MKRSVEAETPPVRLQSPMVGGIDIREVAGCTCLRLRRSSRAATQLFDSHLAHAGITIGQFGVMAQLYGVGVHREAVSVKDLAGLIGVDPTTLVRTLKPMEQQGWVAGRRDPEDRRSRLIRLTDAGRDRLATATPHWEAAQRELRARIGDGPALALNGLLDLARNRLPLERPGVDDPT